MPSQPPEGPSGTPDAGDRAGRARLLSRTIGRRVRAMRDLPGGRDAGLLLGARVAMSAQRALVGVVVPVYLAKRGLSGLEVGLLFTAVGLTSAALSAIVGYGADHIGRRHFVIYVPLLSASAAVVFALSSDLTALYIAAAVGSFGRGAGAGAGMVGPYQPAEQALLAGLASDRNRARLFSLVASASALGGLAGSILAASPLTAPASGTVGSATYRAVFIAAFALAALAAALAVPVREHRSKQHQDEEQLLSAAPDPPSAAKPDGRSDALTDPDAGRGRSRLSPAARSLVARLIATNTVNGAAVGLFGPFISYWLYLRFHADPSQIGMIYIVANVVTILTNQFAAPAAERLGTVRTVVWARSIQAVLLIPLALSPSLLAVGAIYTLRLTFQRVGMALRQSFVMSAAPAAERAKVAALSQLPGLGAAAIAPTFAGYLYTEVSLALPFELAGALQLINAGLFQYFFGSSARKAASASADQKRAATASAAEPAEEEQLQ